MRGCADEKEPEWDLGEAEEFLEVDEDTVKGPVGGAEAIPVVGRLHAHTGR
jgi:hypothetical protein